MAQIFKKIYATSANFTRIAHDEALCMELAHALVRYIAWSDTEDSIGVLELRNTLCSLCSFRVLQKRLQVWFRAVPNMHPSMLKNVAAFLNADHVSHGMVTTPVFIRASEASSLPLSQESAYMLTKLLTRRRPPVSGRHTGAGGEADSMATMPYVDVALLQRIKTGDFLHAALV